MVECSERSAQSDRLNMKPTGRIMQSETAKPKNAKRKAMSKTDALEMLSSFLADLVLAGVQVDHESAGGVVTLRLHGVAEAIDDEGVYFVPYVEPAAS